MKNFSRSTIERLLHKLNAQLELKSVRGELYLVGGAVMCLIYNARPATKDIDAAFKPSTIIREIASEIAEEEGLAPNWLNDGVKGFFGDAAAFESFLELSHLSIFQPQPEYLLAMKCLAMRLGAEFHDESDVRYLLRHLNIERYEEALSVIGKFYPLDKFPQKTLYALEELCSS